MVLIIVPVPRRYVFYYCPHCRRRETSFFSWLPLRRPEWRCRSCHKTFQLPPACMARNWAGVAGLYTLLPSFLAGVLVFAVGVLMSDRAAPQKIPLHLVGALVLGGPTFMLLGGVLSLIIGYMAGLIYGAAAARRLRGDRFRKYSPFCR